GSSAGLEPVAAWKAEGDRASSSYGSSVATAGDVNGDGFDDVIVGAPFWRNGERDEGSAFLYLGSPGGPATTPVWVVEGDEEEALLGYTAETAGDVNGDGFGAVIVGALRP